MKPMIMIIIGTAVVVSIFIIGFMVFYSKEEKDSITSSENTDSRNEDAGSTESTTNPLEDIEARDYSPSAPQLEEESLQPSISIIEPAKQKQTSNKQIPEEQTNNIENKGLSKKEDTGSTDIFLLPQLKTDEYILDKINKEDKLETSSFPPSNLLNFYNKYTSPEYSSRLGFIEAAFEFIEDPPYLDWKMKELYAFILKKEMATKKLHHKVYDYINSYFKKNPLEELLSKNVNEALSFYFNKAELNLKSEDTDTTNKQFKNALVVTLNLIRSSEEYKSKLKIKKDARKIQKTFLDDDVTEEEINFKSPVKIDDKLYRFDILNLIMNNRPMKRYILGTLEEAEESKFKELMEKQFSYNTTAKEEKKYIQSTFSDFIDFNGDPFEIFKALLITKRQPELEEHKQLYMGKIEFSLKDKETETYEFKYNQELDIQTKKDNATPGLPLITLNIEDIIADNKADAQNTISIQNRIVNYVYRGDLEQKYNTLSFDSMSIFMNQFPFLIIKIEETVAQQNNKITKLMCEKTIIVPEINNFYKKYELTGFLMENTSLKNNAKPIFECFNIYNNKLLDAIQTEKHKTELLKTTVGSEVTSKSAFVFSLGDDAARRIRYLLYKRIPDSSTLNEEKQ
ncbi:hypothetical protein CDIK_1469 [Cucumispora dikerogammari]|nr:hypothetical protein CDIK_1469 [Cucumispora dikerogammari]